MPSVLVVNSSGRQERSISRELVSKVVAKLGATTTVVRDVGANAVPIVDINWIRTRFDPEASDENRNAISTVTSNTVSDEVLAADVIVIGTPMYNFNISAALKAWVDSIIVVGKTVKYTENGAEGQLKGKKVFFVYSSGVVEADSPIDFAAPYMKFIFGYLGVTDVTFIFAPKGNKENAEKIIEGIQPL